MSLLLGSRGGERDADLLVGTAVSLVHPLQPPVPAGSGAERSGGGGAGGGPASLRVVLLSEVEAGQVQGERHQPEQPRVNSQPQRTPHMFWSQNGVHGVIMVDFFPK